MNLLATARRLESKIARTLDGAAHRAMGSPPRDPLAIIHAVVEAIADELQPAGRGRRVFPYNSVTVTLAAPAPADRARYEAVLECGPPLRDRIVDRLRTGGADVEQPLEVRTLYVRDPQADWNHSDFHLNLARLSAPRQPPPPDPVVQDPIDLTVLHGDAAQESYSLALARFDIGRGMQVRDRRNHVVRTNHVAFADGGEVNASVSRRHAHITWDPSSGVYRIYDDGSTQGTHVLRMGATVVVRTGARGTRLRDGDEILLGEARLRVTLPARPRSGATAEGDAPLLRRSPDRRR